ncbi:hypothetical protein QE152_g40759 [Popillia japonica]|uniref:Uncharacterized protein n=1 Tax=Popillia japonica TaxID=7064 RepID=A0AAW1HFG2_POPJA
MGEVGEACDCSSKNCVPADNSIICNDIEEKSQVDPCLQAFFDDTEDPEFFEDYNLKICLNETVEDYNLKICLNETNNLQTNQIEFYEYYVAVFADLTSAYDIVWGEGLFMKLLKFIPCPKTTC